MSDCNFWRRNATNNMQIVNEIGRGNEQAISGHVYRINANYEHTRINIICKNRIKTSKERLSSGVTKHFILSVFAMVLYYIIGHTLVPT